MYLNDNLSSSLVILELGLTVTLDVFKYHYNIPPYTNIFD